MFEHRLDFRATAPQAYAAVSAVERYIQSCGLEKSLIELVKMRASQINGCAYCLDKHSRNARHHGETERRLCVLTALYSPRERAALAWTECLTNVATEGVPDDTCTALEAHFSLKEIVKLRILIGLINLWNRLAIDMPAQHPGRGGGVIAVTLCEATSDAKILACWPVMRELRPHLTDAAVFTERVRRQQHDGYRLLAAWQADAAIGLAGCGCWRR